MISLPVGDRALLVEFSGPEEVRSYYEEACRRRRQGALADVVDIVPAARTILFDGVDDPAALAAAIATWGPPPAPRLRGRLVELPVVYDGPDLAAVAELWGVAPDAVGPLHCGLAHEVAFLGFSPGFAYITGLRAEMRVPRLARPRTAVPAGSVAVADEYTGIYPRPSPGGWRLIGRTSVALWDATREPASTLLPGDTVRFVVRPGQ